MFEVSGKMAVKIVEKVKCILDMYMFKFSLLFPIKSYDVYTLFFFSAMLSFPHEPQKEHVIMINNFTKITCEYDLLDLCIK